MFEIALLLSATVAEPARAAVPPPITVVGRRASYFNRITCRHLYNSAVTRIRSSGRRLCATQAQRDDIRDQSHEFFTDLGRRNGPPR